MMLSRPATGVVRQAIQPGTFVRKCTSTASMKRRVLDALRQLLPVNYLKKTRSLCTSTSLAHRFGIGEGVRWQAAVAISAARLLS